jgi:hypothetical protein
VAHGVGGGLAADVQPFGDVAIRQTVADQRDAALA